MLIRDTALTPALARWLRESHDDGEPELQPRELRLGMARTRNIRVLRTDGSEPSTTETTEITARLAAHAAEPLQ